MALIKDSLARVQKPGTARPTILIIEQDLFLQEIYKEKFISKGYHVLIVEDEKQGVEYINRYLPDVVLFDVLPPEVERLQTIRSLQTNSKTQHISFFILSVLTEDRINEILTFKNHSINTLNAFKSSPAEIEEKVSEHLASEVNNSLKD